MRLSILVVCVACSSDPAPPPVPEVPLRELCEKAMRNLADINLDELGTPPKAREIVYAMELPKAVEKCLKKPRGEVECIAAARGRAALYKCGP